MGEGGYTVLDTPEPEIEETPDEPSFEETLAEPSLQEDDEAGETTPAPAATAPEIVRGFRALDYVVAALVASIALALYLRTLAPTVYGEDSGELVSAAYTLGIPHPTGYPLWCILAKFFMTVIPGGDPAWRANVMSAFFGAATVFVIAMVIAEVVRIRWASLVGALALAFSFEFWEQSVVAEVYTLNAFLTALCTLTILVWRRTANPRYLAAFGLFFGLGLSNHQVILLMAPAFVLFVLWYGRFSQTALRSYAIAFAYALAGFTVNLYLPIRALAHPPMNWGDPENFRNLWDVLTRAQFQFIITDGPRSLPRFLSQFWIYCGIYFRQFTPGVGAAAAIGAVALWRRDRGVAVLLIAQFAVISIACIIIPNFDLDRKSIWINTTYWIPAYLVAAVLIAAGMHSIASLPKRRWVKGTAISMLAIAGVGAPFVSNFASNDKSRFYFARDCGENILRTMEQDAIYFADGDHMLFPVAYLQIVEGKRPDIVLANLYGYPTERVYHDMPDDAKQSFAHIPSEADEQTIFQWVLDHSGRPVYTTIARRAEGWRAENAGLLYRMVRAGTSPRNHDYWGDYTWHTINGDVIEGDWSAELILYQYNFARGRYFFETGLLDAALKSFDAAEKLAARDKDGLNNLGCAAAEYDRIELADHYFEEALSLDPLFKTARMNLAKAYARQGRFAAAREQIDSLLEQNPADPEAERLRDECAGHLDAPASP